MVQRHSPSLLPEHGRNLELERKWAESFMSRMGLVRRKTTKAARKRPADFECLKVEFQQRITKIVQDHSPALILKTDQTATKLVPTSDWTMAAESSIQVSVVGLEDWQKITVVLCCSLSGQFLPPQVLYTGQTPQCHPKNSFPEGWDTASHSPNHWSNEQTMLQYVDNVLTPYLTDTRAQLGILPDQIALIIGDVFAAHRCNSLLEKCAKNHVKVVHVPAGCTGDLRTTPRCHCKLGL